MARHIRWVAATMSLVMVGTGSVTAHADGGVRLGPAQTLCVAAPGTSPGDVALINTTVVHASATGFVTAHNPNTNPFGVSSVNTTGRPAVPNLTATVVTDDTEVCITSSLSMSSHIVLDLVGVIAGSAFTAESGGAKRLLDTRARPTPLQPNETTCVTVPGAAAGDVAFVNATVTKASGPGHLTVHSAANANPGATSSLNFAPGDTLANLTMTVLSSNSQVCATASQWSSTHVILDVVGTLDGASFDRAGIFPTRVLDTRRTFGPTASKPIPAAETVCVDTPTSTAGAGVFANVTITQPSATGYATVHRLGAPPTATSTHNFGGGQTVANMTATAIGDDGDLCVTPSKLSSAHAVIDLIGTVSADVFSAPSGGATRILDTRTADSLPGRYGTPTLRYLSCDDLLAQLKSSRLAELDRHEAAFGDGPFVFLPQTNGNAPASVPDFSTTNTQDADVDEGDVVETDGIFLYDVTQRADDATGELRVIEIASAKQVASVPLTGAYPEIILHDGRIMATTRGTADNFTRTNVTKIDVSDPRKPVILDRYGLDGTRRTMRSVSGNVHTVLRSDRKPDDFRFGFGDDLETSREAIANSTIDDWLPRTFPIRPDGSYGEPVVTVDCSRLGVPNIDQGTGFTWIAEDDLTSGAGLDGSTGVIAEVGQVEVMANARNLYISVTSYVPWFGRFLPGEQTTGIHLFEMAGDGPTTYQASTEVPGRLINQFAMSEYDGVLRVAVTDGWWNTADSSVFALRPTGSTFERMSVVSGLGFGERIFAVRHLGPMSYVVTFRETDPLYVVDFRDPLRPVLAGELKIPGFSNYLHPAGDGLLIGVGQDAELDGNRLGAQVSLFDVADPNNPRLLDTEFVGGDYEVTDHREFLFWPRSGAIAIPAYDAARLGVAVTELVGRRLRPVGRIGGTNSLCGPVRTIVVGDELIVVSADSVIFADLDTLAVRSRVGTCSPFIVID